MPRRQARARAARLHPSPVFGGLRDSKEHPLLVGYIYSMQNSITFMGPFIVQNSQQRCYSAGRFGHFLEGKRPGKCQTWPQYNEDLWTCLGAIRASIASPLRWRVALPLLYNSWKSKEKYYSTQSFWISPKAFLEKLTWFWLLWRAIRRAGRKR